MAKERGQPADEASPGDPKFDMIAPDGDVIFALNKDGTKVRVHSAIMKNSSPVFTAMLGPNFKEGRALSAGNGIPVEISLPEDDPIAFGWVCRVLHSQADTKLWSPEPKKIAQVLDIANKYDLMDGIQLSVNIWINHQINTSADPDYWSLLLASYRAHDHDTFETTSRHLVLKYKDSFVKLAAKSESSIPRPDEQCVMFRLAVA
ncbi:hypothetical protein N0V84_008988 [Fusarium piperis]|uniref:BTB domain-containing protein n=1 Tax=Fusarium piperis TaxID=1435070 RepID=A0A9W8W7A0_9HYPO|nr:hypothetical protein N0V84_008988 [Fusarium piperis]